LYSIEVSRYDSKQYTAKP